VVIDGLVPESDLARLAQALRKEPLFPQEDEHHAFRGGVEPPQQPLLRALWEELNEAPALTAISALCGRTVRAANARVYAYRRGHYLLPHNDCRAGEARRVAFAWYLAERVPLRGGELELFAYGPKDRAPASAIPVKRIAPKPGRLVLFAVAPVALHQVREVTGGERFSLAGWFVR
jgi:Rps23 Pro-64 3,4-dihydroxylase Tpa1-like proline 4-hydroxylase